MLNKYLVFLKPLIQFSSVYSEHQITKESSQGTLHLDKST